MDDVVELISETSEVDEDFNAVGRTEARRVFCRVRSVSRAEFYAAGQAGLSPSLVLEVFYGEYAGERIALFHGKEYVIYRTYRDIESDTIELYLEDKVGVTDGSTDR